MQIELAPEVEAKLAEEAGQLGLSPTEFSAEILTTYAAQISSSETAPQAEEARDKLFADHIAWLKRSSPSWEANDPYAFDWQAIKAEGRKY